MSSDLEENRALKTTRGAEAGDLADDFLEHLIDHQHHHLSVITSSADQYYEKTTNKKTDGRLFHEYPLYCEGPPKPICRGVLHLVDSL